jgi:hypothetical protein
MAVIGPSHLDVQKTYEVVIGKLKAGLRFTFKNPETALTDPDDQIKILEEMERDDVRPKYAMNVESLFYHVDNIRFVYNEKNKTLPKWYEQKYQAHFLQDRFEK